MNVIEKACKLFESGKEHKALDIIWDDIDDKLIYRKFDDVNQLLISLDPNELPITLRICILTATLPAHHHLPARAEFYQRVRDSLEGEEPERIQGLIGGLDIPPDPNWPAYILKLYNWQ